MGVYFRAETIAASAGAVYDDPALVADTGGNFGLHIGQTNKVRAYVYDGAPKVVDATIAPATDYLAIMRWDSTNLEMILNGTAQTPTAAGALTGFLEGTMRLGVNYASAAYFNGKQSLVFTLPSKISDANAAKARKYVISKGWTTPTTPLLDVDFSALSLGGMSAASFLMSTGLTFTRTSVSTVQTSASAVDSTPGVDYACIGDRASGSRGLVIQHNTRNLYSTSGQARDWTSGWTGGSGCTVSASTGVDGTANTGQLVITSGGFGPYLNSPASQRFTFSSWLRSVVADPQQFAWNNGSTAANADVVNAAGTTTWQRLKIAKGTTTRQYSTVCDCRDYSAVGGTTAQARSVIADYAQYEAGDFVTEAIPTGTGYRTVDMLSYATGSSLVASTGEVRFYAKMIPKFSSTMGVNYDGTAANGVSAAWYLFSWGANGQNYAKINDSDKKLYVRIANGAAVTSTNAIAFSAFDVLEVDVRVGNNVSSVARYRLNAGAWVDLVLATVIDVPNPGANPIRVLSNDNATANGDSGAFPCWLQRVTFHSDAGSPS